MTRAIGARMVRLSFALSFVATAARAQTTSLRGRVIDARTAAGLAEVMVVLTSGRDTIARARTDASGRFQAAAPTTARMNGAVVAHFAHIGFQADSIAMPPDGEMPLRVAMLPLSVMATSLSAVVVRDTARSSFERRARRNAGGIFIRDADVEKQHPVRTSELLRRIPGLTVADSGGIMQVVSLRGYRPTSPSAATARRTTVGGDTVSMPTSDGRRCIVRIGVNGRLMPEDFSVDDVRPDEIAGIEIYQSAATLPVEFSTVQHDAPCGMIMIWMKGAPR